LQIPPIHFTFRVEFGSARTTTRVEKTEQGKSSLEAGLPDYSWYNIPNGHKIYQMATKIPNGRKVRQTAIKYTNIFHYKTLQNLPKLGFLV
jgi:hypothetical protein